MGAQTTSSTAAGHAKEGAGRGRGILLGALTAALFSLSAGAAAASPVVTPPSPQHLPQQAGHACEHLDALPAPSAVDGGEEPWRTVCRNVNGWQ